VRRVELTHDVLCGVVKSSRDLRHERESREATERLLAEQRSRELAAHGALLRARQIAIGCTILAVGAIIAAVFAYFSTQRARRAEIEAQQTRATAEQARGQAEHLLGYLSDDFVRELESFGRLKVIAEFSQRQIDYFHALPPALKGNETTRNGALALVHHARAMRTLGHPDIGIANATEAEQLLERQRTAGDGSEATTIALALAYSINAALLDNQNDSGGPLAGKRASELLRPLAEAPGASVAARRAYVEVLSRIGFEQQAANQLDDAVLTEQKSMRFASALGARDLADLDMGAYYAESAGWMVTALANLGRNDEARKGGEDALAVADKVLEQRPGFRLALHAEGIIQNVLAFVAQNEMNLAEALRLNQRSLQTSLTLLKLDPNNTTSINNMAVAYQVQGDFLWSLGKVREAMPYYLKSLDEYSAASAGGAGFVVVHSYDIAITAFRQAQIGDAAGSAETVAKGVPFLTRLRASQPKGSMAVIIVAAMEKIPTAGGAFERDDLATARSVAADAVAQLQSAKPDGALQASQRAISVYVAAHIAGRAEFGLGNFTAAEQAERTALAARKEWGNLATPDQRDLGELSTWLAMSLARQGRIADAAQTIGPVVKFQRELAARNHDDKWQPLELAGALYAQSLTDKNRSAALLLEAAGLVERMAPTLRDLHDVRLWRDLIRQAQKTAAQLTAPAAGERSAG
jgi:tetratricopeptide (TPR) repeat protein